MSDASNSITALMLIGHLIANWANNESVFIRILESLLGLSDESARTVFYSHKNSLARLDLVSASAKLSLGDADITELESLIVRFRNLSRLRNYFAHCTYVHDDAGNWVRTENTKFDAKRRTFVPHDKVFNAACLNELRQASAALKGLNADLWTFSNRLDDRLGKPHGGRPHTPPSKGTGARHRLAEYIHPPTKERRPALPEKDQG